MILAGQELTADVLNDNSPRTIGFAALTANTANSTSTAELAGITTPTLLFRNGRAYRIHFKGRMVGNTAGDQGQFSVRKTNTAGTILVSTYRAAVGSPAGTFWFDLETVVANASGADTSLPLIGTYNRTAGAGNIALGGSPSDPSYIEVTDIGLATDFPSAASIA